MLFGWVNAGFSSLANHCNFNQERRRRPCILSGRAGQEIWKTLQDLQIQDDGGGCGKNRGQRREDRGERREDRGQRREERGLQDRGRRSEIGGQGVEEDEWMNSLAGMDGRLDGRRTEVGGQRSAKKEGEKVGGKKTRG